MRNLRLRFLRWYCRRGIFRQGLAANQTVNIHTGIFHGIAAVIVTHARFSSSSSIIEETEFLAVFGTFLQAVDPWINASH
jgi:hypothetical protein